MATARPHYTSVLALNKVFKPIQEVVFLAEKSQENYYFAILGASALGATDMNRDSQPFVKKA